MSVEIKEKIRAAADGMKKDIAIAKDGVVTVAEDLYEKSLEDSGLTMDVVQKVQKHDVQFVEATALAFGELATEACKKNRDLDAVTVKIAAGKSEVGHHYQPKQELQGKGDEKKVVYGSMVSSFETAAGSSKSGLKKVRQHIAEMSEEIFG